MDVRRIYMQKIAEIQSRLPVPIFKNNCTINDAGTVNNKSSSDNTSDFGSLLDYNINKLKNIKSSDNLNSVNSKNEDAPLKGNLFDVVKPYLNIPYVWGGTSTKGFDCSGFTKYVMDKFGVELNRVSKDQAKEGEYVPRSELKEGDLIFFDTKGNGVSHVGIYLGNDEFVHASSAAKKVTVSSLNDSFYNKAYVSGRRVLSA